ncbi:hypothetical protein AAZX31_18G153900 [Glycine max]|nr:hypothetical protein GLYMA_18G169750v4 [Glycine max]KAG4377616.1 hypothetical protein GLYMA_18G169750v4 [Glycine max]
MNLEMEKSKIYSLNPRPVISKLPQQANMGVVVILPNTLSTEIITISKVAAIFALIRTQLRVPPRYTPRTFGKDQRSGKPSRITAKHKHCFTTPSANGKTQHWRVAGYCPCSNVPKTNMSNQRRSSREHQKRHHC